MLTRHRPLTYGGEIGRSGWERSLSRGGESRLYSSNKVGTFWQSGGILWRCEGLTLFPSRRGEVSQ